MAPCGIFHHRAGDSKDPKVEHRAPNNQEGPAIYDGKSDDESILQARESSAQSTQVSVARIASAVFRKKKAASKSTDSQKTHPTGDLKRASDSETASLWARQLLEKMNQARGQAANDQRTSQAQSSQQAS